MFKVNRIKNEIQLLEKVSFSSLKLREREHLQEWISKEPSCLGEELLIIQKEFDGFEDTRERLDLLALDKAGNLVLIENKLDDSGRDVVWQSLKYTAYVSTLTTSQIIEIYQNYIKEDRNAEEEILEFVDGEESIETLVLNEDQRIILIAAMFRKEVTATALWLTKKGVDITCIRATPHKIDEHLLLDFDQIIPIQDAEDYLILLADKDKESGERRRVKKETGETNREYWEQLLPIIRENTDAFQNVNASGDHWLSNSAGISGVSFNIKLTRKSIGIELYIATSKVENNKLIFNKIYEQRLEIEDKFGKNLVWEILEARKGSRISISEECINTHEKSTWGQNNEFFVENLQNFINALKPKLLEANNEVINNF